MCQRHRHHHHPLPGSFTGDCREREEEKGRGGSDVLRWCERGGRGGKSVSVATITGEAAQSRDQARQLPAALHKAGKVSVQADRPRLLVTYLFN